MKSCRDRYCSQINPQSFDNFPKRKNTKDGFNYYCKKCISVRTKKWKSVLGNSEKQEKYRTHWRKDPKNKNRIRASKDKPENKKKRLARQKAYEAKWRSTPIGKLIKSIRSQSQRIKNVSIGSYITSSVDILGTSYENAKSHLEFLFLDGMSWDNHGEWHIDHIIPLASAGNDFELSKKLGCYLNLQPLWNIDNLRKNDSLLSLDGICKFQNNSKQSETHEKIYNYLKEVEEILDNKGS